MSNLQDREYLLTDQYKNASNLNARFQLHERFSINKYGWHPWVFDQLNLPPKCRILELGCGLGALWLKNMDKIPTGWGITLSDFSLGMLQDIQRNLSVCKHPFKFEVIDAQSIPFADESFDAVIANHMLYHVPDREKAYSEISRVLVSDGRFYATTNGQNHLKELRNLGRGFDADAYESGREADSGVMSAKFTLENGMDELSRWFSKVTRWRYADGLVITEVEPLLDWATSWAKPIFCEKFNEFLSFLDNEFASQGAIRVTKDSGLFEALTRKSVMGFNGRTSPN